MIGSLLVAAAAVAAPAPTGDVAIGPLSATVELGVSPASRKLTGRAKLRFRAAGAGVARLALHPDLAVTRVAIDDKAVRFTRKGDQLEVAIAKATRASTLAVDYAGRPAITDPADRAQAQDVGPEGLVLRPGGGWLPAPAGATGFATTVTLRAPAGWRAVGPATRTSVEPARQASRLDFAAGTAPGLVAAPYKVFSAGGHTFYALSATAPVSLGTAADMIAALRARGLQAGPPVAPGRAANGSLVELPAGYAPLVARGFAAGPRPPGGVGEWLAALAFSPVDPAEAARPERTWLVDSLSAYCADVVAERAGGKPAREAARRAHLEAYTAFLRRRPGQDRALDQAITPDQEAWVPVVRDKGALVWGLLRESMGDDGFWAMLRRWQSKVRAGDGEWPAFRAALGPRHAWLDGWLRQPGLPDARLQEMRLVQQGGRWQVMGTLTQAGAFFGMPIDLALVTESGVERVSFTAFAPRVPFHFVAGARPLRVVLDGADRAPVRRRPNLAIAEGVAPADGVIVYGTQGDEPDNQASRQAAEAMRERLRKFKGLDLPVRADRELTAQERGRSLLVMGRPGVNAVATELADQFPVRFIRGKAPDGTDVPVDGKAIWWQGRAFTRPDHGVVQIVANPQAPERTVVLFAGLSPRAQADALRFTQRPATFCVFQAGNVAEEGDALRAFPDLDAVLY